LVIVIVTATDLDVKTSTSTCSVVGGSMSSMFGSLLVIVMGIEYVPPRFTAAQLTLTVSAFVVSESSVSWSPPTRTTTLFTGCTSTKPAGIFAGLCGTGSEIVFVSGGFPA
jgi:hypothetical protein